MPNVKKTGGALKRVGRAGKRPKPLTRSRARDVCEIRCVDAAKVNRSQKAMKAKEKVEALAETFSLLGDPTRLRITYALSREELCVCDLANVLGTSQSVVSHSLRSLRQMRLVRFRREGKIAYYTLDDAHIRSLVEEGFRHVEES